MCQQWGPTPQRGSRGGAVAVVLCAVVVAGLLVKTGAVGHHPGVQALNQKGGGPALAGIFGGFLQNASKQLPKLIQPKQWQRKGRVAKVPHGLSFTNGAGCRPKGDWRRVDPRVRKVLVNAAKRHRIRVSCLHTGHSRYVAGTRRVSNHTVWRAVDIDRVDGRPVRSYNSAARRLALSLGRGQLGARPSEVGSPWAFGRRPWFTDRGHKNHLHVGFRGR